MNRSIGSRLIATLCLAAALIIGGAIAIDYRLSRQQILERLALQARSEVQVVVADLENWLGGVEATTGLLARILEQRDYSEAGLKQILRDAVANNDEIFGAAIAVNPALAGTAGGFAPYFFSDGGAVSYADLAGAAYQDQDWFKQPAAAGRALWTEPYFDTGGGSEANLTTFAVPVYRPGAGGERHLYAVVTADVRLEDLHRVIQQLHLGEHSYGLLFSRRGLLMSGRLREHLMHHYSRIHYQGVDLDSWQGMFQRALAGESSTYDFTCPETGGRCTIHLGRLDSTGWPLAVVFSQAEVLAPLHRYQLRTALISAATLLLMALAVYLLTARLTRPLRQLSEAAATMGRGDLDAPLPRPRGDDEIATLVRSFGSMSRELKHHIAELETETANRSRLEGELAAAREIQMSMLPGGGEILWRGGSVELWARVEPAKAVGGDLYALYPVGKHLVIAVGDVSDKGVPAALFMARSMSLIRQLSATGAAPERAMAELNNALERDNHSCMFVTLFLGVLDIAAARLDFASAGHPAPSLLGRTGAGAIEQETGPALGLAPNQPYPANTLQLAPGDRLAIFTDGVDEAFGEAGDMFGIQRFDRALAESAGDTVAEAGAGLFRALAAHAGSRAQSDDITLMLVEVAPGYAHRNFPLGPELIRAIHAWIDPLLAGWAIDEDSARELQLVAEEIASNVAQYAGLEAGDSLELELVYRGAELALEVRDGGFAFNPLENAGRSALGRGSDSAEIGGLGVHLLTLLTDRQEYRRDGNYNVLRVVKDLSAPTCKPGANREARQAHEAEHMDLTTTVSIDEENSVARVALAGALNTDTAPAFELRLQDVVDAGHQLTVLDMQDLNYISSAGLRVIFKAAKQTRGEGRKLAAANRKPHIDKVFEILKALPDMAVFANEQELDDYLEAMQADARGA